MTKKNKEKLRYLFNNLEQDVVRELRGVDLSGVFTDAELESKARNILYILSPYGKDLDTYRFFDKWTTEKTEKTKSEQHIVWRSWINKKVQFDDQKAVVEKMYHDGSLNTSYFEMTNGGIVRCARCSLLSGFEVKKEK